MATARFDAGITGSYEAANYVTPKEGVKDSSTAAFLGAVGNAVDKGLAADAAFSGRDMRTEATAMVEGELRQGEQAAKDNIANLSELSDFSNQVSRAEQIQKMGGRDTAARIQLQMQKNVRDKISDKPWLANEYRQVASQVIGDYSADIEAIQGLEAKIAEVASDNKMHENLVKHAYTIAAEVNLAFPKPPDLMTPPELLGFVQQASEVRQQQMLADEARQNATIAAQIQAARAQEGAARATYATAAMQNERMIAEQNDKRYANASIGAFTSRLNSKLSAVTNALKSGGFVIDEGRMEADATQFIAETSKEFYEAITNYPWTDFSERDRQIALFEQRSQALRDAFVGDLSNDKSRGREINRMQQSQNINLYERAPEAAFLIDKFPGAGGIIVEKIFNGDQGKVNEKKFVEGVTGAIGMSEAGGRAIRAVIDTLSTGEPVTVGKDLYTPVRSELLNIHKNSTTIPVLSEVLDAQPVMFGNSLKFILDGVSDAEMGSKDKAAIVDYSLKGFDKRFTALKQENPQLASELSYGVEDFAKQTVPGVIADAASLPRPLTLEGDDRFRAPPMANQKTIQVTQRMNNLLDSLTALYDGRVKDPRGYVLEQYFGVQGRMQDADAK